MARSRGPIYFCAIALLLLCTTTTIQAEKCRTGCQGVTPNTFKYQEGTTYKYNLEGNIDISLSTAENQHTTTKLSGTVLLSQQGNCNQVLRLQNVQVVGPDAKKYSGLANIEKPIRINFHDGHIEDEICAEPEDTQNSLNIKRAVASMFQAALKQEEESDIFGKCPNDITTRKDGNTLIIQKHRDLNRCSHRESYKQDFMATSFNVKAVPGSSPFINSFDSEQRVKNGILEHALVNEHYLYKPLSDGKDHGIKAVITTKLTLAGQSKEKVASKATEPKSIYFESPHQEVTKTANVDNILNALKETKKTMDVSVSERSASTFLQLIEVLRASKKDDILAVYGQIKTGAAGFQDKQAARKVFFDALFRTGTGDAIEVVIELLKNKELSAIEQKLVYLSFAFVRHATKGSLNSATVLLDLPNLPREAYLGIGSLAGRFCSEHSCENVDELNKLMEKLTSKLTSHPANRKAENEVMAVLKAIGNVRHLTDSIVDKLVQVISDKKGPARVRVAALEAALSDACKPKLINAALNILKNRQEDSEIRIKAYLVLAECPDNKVANALKELLDTEPVYQVGGFIVSHLRNLRASVNPDHEHAKQVLGNVRTNKVFPIDPRKYSFNNELSYNFDTFGNGANLESNVIYSQNSYIPRSMALNLSMELFGHDFNILEVGGRQENLDKVLEHYLGPLGVLNSKTPEELFDTGKETGKKIYEHIKHRLEKTRGKRDVSKNEIDAFAKTVKVYGNELNKDLDLDLSLKMFGSEFLFLSLNEDIQELTPDAFIDKVFDCLDEGLDKAKSFEYHLKNHLLFSDVQVDYPSSLGFPLRFTLQGTAAVHFITSGNIDIRQILKDPFNSQVKLQVIPSANVEVSGTIGIDAYFVQTGVKITSNVLTSTGTDLTVKLLNNKGIDIKLGLPVQKQKIISFSHDVEFFNQEHGKSLVPVPLKFKDKQWETSICFDQLSPIIGLVFCGEVTSPSSLVTNHVGYPLNGNVKLELAIEREDVKEYHFKALVDTSNPNADTVELTFEAPGSQSERKLSLLMEAIAAPNPTLRLTLKSPLKDAIAEMVITRSDSEKSLMVRFQYDTQEYLAKIGVAISGSNSKRIYKPLIDYQNPNDVVKTKGSRKPDYTVEGQVIVETEGPDNKYTFDHVKLIAPGQPNIEVNGYLSNDGPHGYAADLKISRDGVSVSGKGKLQVTPHNLKLNAEVQNSVNPNANFNVKLELKAHNGEYENNLVLIHGQDLSSKKHCLTIGQSIKYKYEDRENYEFETKNKLTYPLERIEGKLDVHVTRKLVSYDLVVGYDKFKLESELDAKLDAKQFGDYDVKFELDVLNEKVELKAKRDIVGDKSNIHNSLDISGKKYQVDGTITHHIKHNDINVGTDLTIKIHGEPDPIKVDTGLIVNNKQLDTHTKVLCGSTTMVDIVIKESSGANPSGSLKVFVKNLVNANGNYKMTGGKGSGQIVVDIPKMGRKIKAETSITCEHPVHNVALNVYFDFEKDNSQKLHLETNNHITENSIDTKNKIDLLGYVLVANAKANTEGKFNNGKQNGDIEIVLPNHHVLSGKFDREAQEKDDLLHVKAYLLLEHREKSGATPSKFEVKAEGKNVNFDKKVFDLTYHVLAETNKGKNVKADIELKHSHNGEKHNSHYKSKVYGNVLPHPLETEINGQYSEHEGDHTASISYGSDLGAKISGKHNCADGPGLKSGSLGLELILPYEHYKNIKLQINGKTVVPQEPEETIEGEGSIIATLNNAKTVKLQGDIKADRHEGHVKFDLTLPNDQLGLGAKYLREKTETGGKMRGEVDLTYTKGKEIKGAVTLVKVNEDEGEIELDLITPSETAKHINLKLKHKRSNGGNQYHNEIVAKADDKQYTLTNDMVVSEISPSLDIKITCPDGKLSRIYVKLTRNSPKHYTGEVKIDSIKDLNLDASGDANLESIDDFHITINIHSDKLNLHKVKLEALNKPSKSGKRIQFSAKSGDKNLLSGSTSYKANEEGGKFIVEGSGSVKVKEETRTATFKFIKQQFEQAKDGEQGIEILLNAGIGSQGIVGELKITNKQFRILNSYCEEKKQCAHVEIFSKTTDADDAVYNNELEINVDLRKLGLSHEFGLKSVTHRKNFVLDHTVDVHFESSANSKYQYSLYVHPKEAGIQFTTPKRVISLEAKNDVTRKNKALDIKSEIALYMNKKAEPNKKTALSYHHSQDGDENAGHLNAELKYSNPATNKDMLVQYAMKYDVPKHTTEATLDLDIFAKKNQKITATYNGHVEKLDKGFKTVETGTVVSKGLNLDVKFNEEFTLQPDNLDYHFKVLYQLDKSKYEDLIVTTLNPKKFEVQIKGMNHNLLHIDTALQLSQDAQIIDSTVSAFCFQETVTHMEIRNYNTFLLTIHDKAQPQLKLKISSGLILGQIADFRIEIMKGDAKKEVIHASVKLDNAHFLKPDFGINSEYLEKFLIPGISKEMEKNLEAAKKTAEQYQKQISEEIQHLKEVTKKSTPNLKPVADYYKNELIKLKEELLSDKTIQGVSESLRNIVGTVAGIIVNIYSTVEHIGEQFIDTTSKSFSIITDSIAKEILPVIRELGGKILDAYLTVMKSIYELAMVYVVQIVEILKAHQDEINQVATVLSEAFQDFGRLFVKFASQIENEIAALLKNLYHQIKALPIYEELEERYKDLIERLSVPEQLLFVIEELCGTVKEVMPTQEAKHFITVLQDYIGKKLRKEPVDDTEAIQQIYDSFVKAINSLIKLIESQEVEHADYKPLLQNLSPIRLDRFYSVPTGGELKLSPLNLLLSGDFPTLKQILRQTSFSEKDNIPPFDFIGTIIQGQHIFTYDDRHLTFPGKCSYVITKDAVNGNFTVAGEYKDGHLEALTFADKHDLVTIKKNKQIVLNGAPCELPIRHDQLEVFRLYDGIHIKSDAGIHVYVEENLDAIGVHLNGFYHGQTRGLLGNANFEPYDDFTLPNGKISNGEADFGNAYRLNSACGAIKTVDHSSHHHHPACDKLFKEELNFRVCYPFVNPDGYRQACEHGMASGIADTERLIASAYVSACRSRDIFVSVPDRFLKCKEDGKEIDFGTEYSVKTPGKSADILLVVDQAKNNENIFKELVQPVITQVTNELNAKGVSDIEYSLMGYGGEYSDYPSHYTSGGKLSFHDKNLNLKFADPKPEEKIETGNKNLDEIIQSMSNLIDVAEYQLALLPEVDALREALKYPFRSGAIRTIIFVQGNHNASPAPLLVMFKYASQYSYRNGIHFNLITPLEKMSGLEPKQLKNIVGMDEHSVYSLGDAKKKGDGNTELRKELNVHYEYLADYIIHRHRGNVFASNNFLQCKGGQKKQFVQTVSHVIVEDIINNELHMDCHCVKNTPYTATTSCKVVSIKEKEPRKHSVKG